MSTDENRVDSTLFMLPLLVASAVDLKNDPECLKNKSLSTSPSLEPLECTVDDKTPNLTPSPSLMRDFLNACASSLSSKIKG